MTFLSYLKDARGAIITNKLRSSLSILGIIIGVSSVVIMMAIGAGVQENIKKEMASLINNNLTLGTQGGYTTYTNDNVKGYVKAITLTPELAKEIEEAFPEFSGIVTYGTTSMGQIKYGNTSEMSSFAGVPIDYIQKMGLSLNLGSNFNQSDVDNGAEVIVINKNIADRLFPNTNPIGQKVSYNNREYTVIGTLKDASVFGMVFIPITTYRQKVAGNTKISAITIKLPAEANNALRIARVQYFLLRKYNVSHLDLAWFTLSSTAAMGDSLNSTMAMFSIFLGAIGGISLLVGGIGVMNIMLVSVTERTREIWIRKAIGALNKDIVQQFLIESIVITFVGGLFSLGFSFLVQYIVNNLGIGMGGGGMGGGGALSMQITTNVMLIAFTVTLLVGVLAGILPAKRAANLKPIEALRFE